MGGTLNNQLLIAIPDSKVANKAMNNPVYILDNGVRVTGLAQIGISGINIGLIRSDAANYTASTNNTNIYGQITFEIN